jgi:hypothetical protein
MGVDVVLGIRLGSRNVGLQFPCSDDVPESESLGGRKVPDSLPAVGSGQVVRRRSNSGMEVE